MQYQVLNNWLSTQAAANRSPLLLPVFVMAWSPFQRSNAGIIWVEHPGDYANPIPTTPATAPQVLTKAKRLSKYDRNRARQSRTHPAQNAGSLQESNHD